MNPNNETPAPGLRLPMEQNDEQAARVAQLKEDWIETPCGRLDDLGAVYATVVVPNLTPFQRN